MRKLRRQFVATTGLFVLAVAAFVGEWAFGLPVDRWITTMVILISGCVAAGTYRTITSITTLQEANEKAMQLQRAENDQLVRRVADENQLLVDRVVAELDGYSDRRVIDALVGAERQKIVNERAGMNTLDLTRFGGRNGTNVTDIRQHHRRNDAG